MRGIPLGKVLANMGALLYKTDGIGGGASKETFELSHEVESLDYFLSHSWRDRADFKWLALLWEINLPFALLVANLGGFVFGSALVDSLPGKVFPWGSPDVTILSSFLLLLAFVFAHRVTGRNPTVFLDKACINQIDPELKQLGIKNIGAFLRRSDKILVLWDKDYFDRLWCCYELSLYVKLRGAERII